MKNKLKTINIVLLLTAVFIFAACSAGLENLSTAKENVVKYYKSGQYDKDVNSVVDKTINKFENFSPVKNDAVVFDVDETVLSNYKFEKELDFGYYSGLWDKWVKEEKAQPIEGVKKLYDFFVSKNFNVIFITGRNDNQYNSTYKNLLSAGYTKFDTLIVRHPDEYNLTALEFKSEKRTALTKKGYQIICDVGDQYSDLDGPDHGYQVKIPNYMYILK